MSIFVPMPRKPRTAQELYDYLMLTEEDSVGTILDLLRGVIEHDSIKQTTLPRSGMRESNSPYERAATRRDRMDRESDYWVRVPSKFNGFVGPHGAGFHVYAGQEGEIKFVNPKAQVDMQTIESVTARMVKDDIYESPELKQLYDDVIRFAIKRKQEK